MVPQLWSGRAPLTKMILGLVLCALFVGPQASALQAETQIQVFANDAGRKIKNRIVPEYPELAKKTRITGVARVQLIVTPEGTVKDVKELGGSPVLLAALVRAVKQWKYEPGAKDTEVEVKANFSR